MFTRAGQGRALWHCMWGRGLRGNSATCSAPSQHSVTSLTTHKQTGPFCCWFPGGWVCVHSRTLWVSPINSAVRLGVSLASATPTGFFSQRFLRLYCPTVEPRFARSVSLPSCSSGFIRMQISVWINPHLPVDKSISHCLTHSSSCCLATSPLHHGCPCPPLLPVRINVSSLTP